MRTNQLIETSNPGRSWTRGKWINQNNKTKQTTRNARNKRSSTMKRVTVHPDLMKGNKSMNSWTPMQSLILAGFANIATVQADMVTDWNFNLEKAAKVAAQLPPVEVRSAAIVQVAVFDAINGIARKYQPYFVTEPAPPGARSDAAVAQAAYTTLKALYPAQAATFDAELADSIASLPGSPGGGVSIARGLAWGEHVANVILAWRSLDGFSTVLPGYFGSTIPGIWRSLPVGT